MLHVVDGATARKRGPADNDRLRQIEHGRLVVWVDQNLARAKTEPVAELVTLTPALAALLLSRNQKNRPISEVGLDRLKRDLLEGRWVFNGESIVVADDGGLNDGQHRCRAVVETGISIRMVIVFGPKRESRMTLDQGVTRTVGHYLTMHGYSHANALAVAANYYCQMKERGRLSNSGKDRPTKTETLLYAEKHKGLSESVAYVSRPGAAALSSVGMLAFCRYAFFEKAGDDPANEFMDRILSGAGLNAGSPILYCRNRLIETKGKANIHERAELIFKAWNAWRLGERVERIVVAGVKLPKLEA